MVGEGLAGLRYSQTLFGDSLVAVSRKVEEGCGEGGFVVMSGRRGD